MKLSEEEKCKRYKDLSNHDKFLARINQPITPIIIPDNELTKEQLEEVHICIDKK